MTIRYLRKNDFDDCWRIFYKVFGRHEDEAFLNAWIHYNPALSYCIESECGNIQGFLLCQKQHVEFIGIDPESQGKGLGTILLHSLLDRCKRESLRISLVPSNSDPKLIRWYEKHGFRKTNELTKEKEVVMMF